MRGIKSEHRYVAYAKNASRTRSTQVDITRPTPGGSGGDDQGGAGEDDDAQVVTDLAQRGGQALPVEQRRQEEQEHDLRRQLHLGQLRHEPNQHADQHQQDRGRDRISARERATHDQGNPQ